MGYRDRRRVISVFYTVDVLAAFHQSDRWPGRAPSARPWFLCLAHRELLQIYFFFTVFFLLSSGLYRKKGVTTRPGRGLMARRYDVSRRLSSVENAVRTLSMVKRENSHAILQKIKKEEIGKIKKIKNKSFPSFFHAPLRQGPFTRPRAHNRRHLSEMKQQFPPISFPSVKNHFFLSPPFRH